MPNEGFEIFAIVTNIRDEKVLRHFGKSLKRMRLEKKLSQQELADYADIPKNQIGRIERGSVNPTLSTLYSIAKALELKNFYELFSDIKI